jgi:hypothetical protein
MVIKVSEIPKYPPIRQNSEILTVAKLFARGEHTWSKGAKYRDESGRPLCVSDPETTPASFDIIGAIDYVYRSANQNLAARIRIGLELNTSPTRWNDSPTTTYDMVVVLVRKVNI